MLLKPVESGLFWSPAGALYWSANLLYWFANDEAYAPTVALKYLPLENGHRVGWRMIARFKSRLEASSFLRQAIILTGGTFLGRVIVVVAMPVLTRIYAPADFSALATYSAILGILTVVSCFRMEIAIPLPASDVHAAALLVIALSGTLFFTLISTGIIIFAYSLEVSMFPAITDPLILWLLPLGVLINGSFLAMQYWTTRQKQFADLARTKIKQAIVGVTAMLILGILSFGAVGLTLGNMLTGGAGAFSLMWHSWRRHGGDFRNINFSTLREMLISYRRFPFWSMPEALVSVAGLQIPILIIAAVTPAAEAGYLMLALQVMLLPMALLGASIGQIYLSRASGEYRDGKLPIFTMYIVKKLLFVGVPPIAVMGLSAPWTFPIIFGSAWLRSGEIAAMMVPWITVQFLWGPVSALIFITGRMKEFFFISVCFTVARILAVSATVFFGYTNITIPIFCLSNAVFYAGLLMVYIVYPSCIKLMVSR